MNTNSDPQDQGPNPFKVLFNYGTPIFIGVVAAVAALQALRPHKAESHPAAPKPNQQIKAAEKPVESVSASNFMSDVKLLTNAMNKTWGGASALQEEFMAAANMVVITGKEDKSGVFVRFRKIFTVGNSVCTVEVTVDKNRRPQSLTFRDKQIKKVTDSADFEIYYDLLVGDKSVSGKYLPLPADPFGDKEIETLDAGSIDKSWWLKLLSKCMSDCRDAYGW